MKEGRPNRTYLYKRRQKQTDKQVSKQANKQKMDHFDEDVRSMFIVNEGNQWYGMVWYGPSSILSCVNFLSFLKKILLAVAITLCYNHLFMSIWQNEICLTD